MARALIIVENASVPADPRVLQQARALRDNGYEVSVICPVSKEDPERYQLLEGIHILRHPRWVEGHNPIGYVVEYANALFWELLLATRLAFTRGFDVIQGCNPPDTIFLIGGLFKLFGKRYIFDQHDLGPELFQAKFQRSGWLRRLMVMLERLSMRVADVVMVTNESYRRLAETRGRARRVVVVRNGPDLERLKVLPPIPALKRGRSYLVGYVGVMAQQDGLDQLLRIVRHIVVDKGRDDVHFGLVGRGSSLAELKAYAAELGIESHVTFTGRVPDQEMLEMLNTADVCVNPDVVSEMNDKSTMIKIMEYMALGKPIVQFDVTEGRFSAGESSLYARPNDEADFAEKILYLLDHAEERERMGAIGRRRVEEVLEWDLQVPHLLAAYEAALNGKGSRTGDRRR